jgi:heme A synthase
MKSKLLYRGAIVVALANLLLLTTGALLTGNFLNWAEQGPKGVIPPFPEGLHLASSVIIAGLTLVLAAALTGAGAVARKVGITIAILALVEGGLGSPALKPQFRPLVPFAHACLAQLLFAAVVAAIVVTSPGWQRGPNPIPDGGWPSLRSLAIMTPVLIFIQIMLGAAFRHQAMGVMAHIIGAMVVALVGLLSGMFVTQQCGEHRSLKPAGVLLITIVFVQVFLGIGAITMRMMNTGNTPLVAAITASHVVVGAMTLAASVALAFQIRCHVTPKEA